MKTKQTLFYITVFAMLLLVSNASAQIIVTETPQWQGPNNASGEIYRGGNVGIGTTNPNTKLHINVPSGQNPFRVQVDGGSRLYTLSNGGTGIGNYSTTVPYRGLYVYGNVGVGTTNPAGKLAVVPASNSRGFEVLSPSAGNTHFPYSNNWNYISGNGVIFRDANHSERVRIDANNGRVGIGTSNPNHELTIQGDDPALVIRDDTNDNSTNAARLELLERAGGSYNGGAFLWWNGNDNKLYIGTKESGINENVMVISRANLNVGIGTSTPHSAYRLSVNGRIRAKEIVVNTGWSDFVFEPDYELMPLEEIEAFIIDHGHLPDIPSAKEVETHGVSVGQMESKLLQKVEELTLHLIALKKQNDQLKADVEVLKNINK